jgi:hypothetical protein
MFHSKILVPKLESVALMYKKKHLQISTNSFTNLMFLLVIDDDRPGGQQSSLPFHDGGHKMT